MPFELVDAECVSERSGSRPDPERRKIVNVHLRGDAQIVDALREPKLQA